MKDINIVFLDIDGVLQPYDAEMRFMSVDKSIIKELSEKFDTDYNKYNFYDVCAVYYDWKQEAVDRLKYILDETNSKIIISSDWRNKFLPDKMKDLLKIQFLDQYYLADTPIFIKFHSIPQTRSEEIRSSIKEYNINNFVVLDDLKDLQEYFPNNSVITHDYIKVSDMNNAIKILKKR